MGVKHLLNYTDLVRKMSGNQIIGPHKGFFFLILKWKANGGLDVEEKDNLNSVQKDYFGSWDKIEHGGTKQKWS
jgi:hypothetical protein